MLACKTRRQRRLAEVAAQQLDRRLALVRGAQRPDRSARADVCRPQ